MERRSSIVNKPRKVYIRALIICATIIIASIVIGNSNMDGMDGKYPLIFLLGFASIVAFITAMIFIPRAREFDRLMSDLKPLAHWQYTNEEWDNFLGESKKEMLSVNKATLRLATIIAAVVGIILIIASRDSLFMVIIAGIILIMAAAAYLGPLIQTSLMKREVKEAFIGQKSAYIGGSFHTWSQKRSKLTGAGIYTEETPVPILHISYEFPNLRRFQHEMIRIPVPAGKMEEAEKIVLELLKQQK